MLIEPPEKTRNSQSESIYINLVSNPLNNQWGKLSKCLGWTIGCKEGKNYGIKLGVIVPILYLATASISTKLENSLDVIKSVHRNGAVALLEGITVVWFRLCERLPNRVVVVEILPLSARASTYQVLRIIYRQTSSGQSRVYRVTHSVA